jgi:acetyltransferase-like isoleucine patch superfamily enzyme
VANPEIRRIGIKDVTFGEGVVVVEPVNLYGCRIGDSSFVGPFVEIQCGAVIGRNCRIQSHVFICDLVEIGNDCFVSHGVMFINDSFSGGGPARGDRAKYRSTRIGNNVSLGTNATILPVSICDNAVVGAGSVVTRDITVPGVYAGNPAVCRRAFPVDDPIHPHP